MMANKQSGEGSKIPQPKFFKIILSQHECSRLRIPVDFASRYCKNMPNPVYLEVPSGEVWEVEVVHFKSQFWIAKGWQDFSDYYSICCGHFLMFEYNGRSHFNVTIFDLSASEIEYPYNAGRGTCQAQERDLIESDDTILGDILRRHRGKRKFSDMVEDSMDNLGECTLGQCSKRNREEAAEDVASPSFTSKGQSSEGGRMHKQQCKIMDKERAIAYQRAKAFKSKNPFILSFMQPSYLSKPYGLSVPFKFARKYFLENCEDLVLRVPGKGSWSVKCSFKTTKAKLSAGWKAFVLDNKLKFGDVGVFEVIEGTKLIDVTIFPAAGSTPMHKIAGRKVSGVSNNSVPCFQSKEVQTKKLKQQKGASYGFNSRIKEEYDEGTGIEHLVEILGHCPLGQSSTRKRLEEEAQDDVSIDIHTKSIKVDKSLEDEASPSFTEKTKKKGESCRTHKQHSKIVYDNSIMIMEKERALAYQRAKAFKSDNPFIISFMQPSYLSTPYILTVPIAFARQYFLEDSGDLVLRVPGRGSWSVRCSIASNAKILSGWKAFVLDNKLKTGDVCVFEVIKGTKLVDVTIFPAAGSTQMHKIADREVPGVCDNSVPCSQSKIVHTKKFKQLRGGPYGYNSEIKEEYGEGTEIEHSVGILGHCLLGQGNKRKRLDEEAEDDVSFDTHTKSIKVEESQEDEASPFARNTKKSGESSRTLKQQSKIFYDRSKTIMEKERAVAYQRAKDFKSENPFIISFLQPSYLSTPYILTVPTAFAQKYLLEDCGELVFRVPGRGSWSVRCSIASNAKIHSGWKAFVLDNKLKIGDVCVFEVIKYSKLIDVTIFPAAGSTSLQMIGVREETGESRSRYMVTASYQRAKTFTSENPFFICSMPPSNVSGRSLTIPWVTASKIFPARHNDLVVQVPNKRSWALKCTIGPRNAKVISGWKEFVLGNNIKVGDVCVFELVSRSKLLFNVIIFPAAEESM